MSTNFLQDLQKGDFPAATGAFTVRMKAGIDAQKLKQIWQQSLPQQFGSFERAATPKAMQQGRHSATITPLKFANGWLDMSVNCNSKHQIEGLFFRPGTAPTAATANATAWITRAAVGKKTLPITVQRDGFVLYGMLDLPTGKGPFPVVDIIPGSGPVTINGNAGGIAYNPYKKLALAFVKAGWAVARIAKRGLPPSTGDGNNIVFANQVADNLAIVEALRKNPHINPNRIVVAGHSIGGLIAPKLATETHLAGLILLEAPGESLTKISTAQAMEMNQQAGGSATRLAAIKKVQEGFYQKVAQTPPGKSISYAGKEYPAWNVQLVKSWYAQEPLATASKVKIPVLVVQGGLDFNTPPGNGKRLVEALPNGTLLYLPRMGHALDVAPCRCLKQLDTGKDATLAPGLAAGIIHWLQVLEPRSDG
ncbi:MAG: alpha/beta fold hydrolase [Gammaproteobacteria bacterium]